MFYHAHDTVSDENNYVIQYEINDPGVRRSLS